MSGESNIFTQTKVNGEYINFVYSFTELFASKIQYFGLMFVASVAATVTISVNTI